MEEKDIQGILKKVEELRAFFTFSVRLIPFLEDLLLFVQEMAPMLNEMNQSILESSSKMPTAVQQLDKVSNATEIATHQMLDKIDDLLGKMDELSNAFSQVNARLKAEKEAVTQISGAVEQLLKLPGARKSLSELFDNEEARKLGIKVKEIVDGFLAGSLEDSIPEKVDQLIQDSQTDAYDIMNSLQVQDITAQQIGAAHSLLSSVQERLNSLITKYSDAEPPGIVSKETAFDEEASFVGAEERQKVADEAMEQVEEEVAEVATAGEAVKTEEAAVEAEAEVAGSQEEIDAMFADAKEEVAEEQGVPVSETFEEGAEDVGSSQEIDELLSWGDDSTAGGEETGATFTIEEEPEAAGAAVEEAAEEPGEAVAGEEAGAAVEDAAEEPGEAVAEEEAGAAEEEAAEEPGEAAAEEEESKKEGDDEMSISQEEIDKLFQ